MRLSGLVAKLWKLFWSQAQLLSYILPRRRVISEVLETNMWDPTDHIEMALRSHFSRRLCDKDVDLLPRNKFAGIAGQNSLGSLWGLLSCVSELLQGMPSSSPTPGGTQQRR